MPTIEEKIFLISVGTFINSPYHPSWHTNCSNFSANFMISRNEIYFFRINDAHKKDDGI
jgi:hypothetical protein